MADIFREIDEEVRRDKAAELWKKYGWVVTALAVLVVVGVAGSSASLDEWIARRPWEEIRAAARSSLVGTTWAELCFGTAFLVSGTGRG